MGWPATPSCQSYRSGSARDAIHPTSEKAKKIQKWPHDRQTHPLSTLKLTPVAGDALLTREGTVLAPTLRRAGAGSLADGAESLAPPPRGTRRWSAWNLRLFGFLGFV